MPIFYHNHDQSGEILFTDKLLVNLAILIGQKRTLPNHLTDVLFGATVILLVIARYVDISYLHGDTSNGEPATMKHWRQYAIGLVLISLAILGVAHGINYLP